MSLPACLVTGTLHQPDGSLAPKHTALTVMKVIKAGSIITLTPVTSYVLGNDGVVSFAVPRASRAFIFAEAYAGTTNLNKNSGVDFDIPDAATATLEALGAAAAFPVQGMTLKVSGVALPGLYGTLNVIGAPFTGAGGVATLDLSGITAPTWADIAGKPSTFPPSAHAASHASAGSDPLTLSQSQITNLVSDLASKAPTSHTHTLSQITDAGTAAAKNAPVSGNAAAGEVVLGNDSRLTDARTPTAHTHTASQITDFNTAVDARVPVASVFGRTGAVLAAANDYTWAQVNKATSSLADLTTRLYSDLQSIPSTFPPSAHNQAWSTITSTPVTLVGYGITDAQPLDSDLTAIAGLSPSNDDLIQRKAGAWTNRTPAQFKADLALVKADVGLGNVENTALSTWAGSSSLTTLGTISTGSIPNTLITGLGTMATQAASGVSITGGSIGGLTAFGVRSSGSGAFDLSIANTENLSAGRTLTVTLNDANRTLTIAGNATISGANSGDQDLSGLVPNTRTVNGHALSANVTVTPTDLSLVIGADVQAFNSNLTTYAGIAPSANVQTLLGSANYAAFRSSLGLVIGTNVQAWDADLDIWAGKTAPAGVVIGTTDSQTLTNKTLDASLNSLSNLTAAMFAANVFDTDSSLAANSSTRIPAQSAVKSYVDNLLTGLKWKGSVVAATVGNITLSGAQTIDGVSVIAGDRVLVKNQTTSSENGIYLCASGAWSRSTDADAAAELIQATCFVQDGTVNADTQWTCTNNAITLGSTSITFAQVSGAGTYSAGAGLSLTGNQFGVATGGITNAMLAGGIVYSNLVLTGAIVNADLAGSIANSKLSNSSVTINGTANRLTGGGAVSLGGSLTLNIDTTLLPSPVIGDVGKFLKVSAANAYIPTAIAESDVTNLVSDLAGKQATLTIGNLTVGSNLSVSGGTGAVIGGGASISLGTAVPTSVVNDTNVTGTISSNALTLGWTGALAKARQHSATVYNDQANTWGNFIQTFQAGANFLLVDPTDTTKKAKFDVSNVTTATTRTVNLPDANSTTVQPDTGASNNFLTAISAQGVISKAQPSFSNLSGTAIAGQLPATAVNAVTNDTNITGSISSQTLTLGFTGTLAKARQNAATVYNDAANTWSTGAQDFGSATSLKVPTGAALAPTANGLIAYDSTANVFSAGFNGTNRIFATRDATETLTNKTLTTPTIASFTNATHNHTNAAGGGQLTIAAFSSTTGSGAIVGATSPTLVTPSIGAATGTSLITTGLISAGGAVSGASAGDLSSSRGTNQGVIWFGTDGARYLQAVGTNLIVSGMTLTAAGLIEVTGSGAGIQIDRRDNSNPAYTLYSSAGGLQFYNNSVGDVWQFSTGGHLLAATDNTYDIGASGATRPRTGYFGTKIVTPTVQHTAVAFASLPGSPVEGMLAAVTDSTTATWGATITGGGSNHVLAYYNGSNWTVAAK